MTIPLQITFHQMPSTVTVERAIREQLVLLGRRSRRLLGCRVLFRSAHRHRALPRAFQVRVELAVPGAQLLADSTARDPGGADPRAAVREAFEKATRLVEHHFAKRRDVRR